MLWCWFDMLTENGIEVGNAEASVCNCFFMSLLNGHIQQLWDKYIGIFFLL